MNLEKLNKTTYRKIAKDNPKDFLEVEIGDIKSEEFHPQVKIKRWDNECNFSVRLNDNETGTPSFSKQGEKVNWKKGNIEVNFFEIENAFKFDYIIKKKPKTNKLSFSIQSKDAVFYPQPPLTEEFQNGYSDEFQRDIVVTETDVKDLEGNVLVHRPENIVGSYAVYAETPKTNWTGEQNIKQER